MRKGIELNKSVVKRLKKLARADKRLLKPYMEKILIEHSETAVAVRQKIKKLKPSDDEK